MASLAINPDIAHRAEEFGGVLFDLETKDFLLLNSPGYRAFELLKAGMSLDGIGGALARADGGGEDSRDHQVLLSSLQMLVSLLRERRVLRPVDGSEVDAEARIGGTPSRSAGRTYPASLPVALKAPLVASICVVFTCNLTCTHCYVGSTTYRPPDTLTEQEIRAVIDRLADLEVFDVVITGGETLIRKDIYRLLRHAKERKLYVCLNTNGTLVTPDRARALKATGVDCVKVSIDSATPEIHDAFRGRSGALAKSLAGIDLLVDAGLRVDIHSVISAESASHEGDVDAILQLAERHGVTKAHFGRIFSTGRATDELKLNNARVQSVVGYVKDRKRQGHPKVGRLSHAEQAEIPGFPTYDGCGACSRGVYRYISYNGGVYPCTNLYKPNWCLGSLREADFEDLWRHSPVMDDLRSKLDPTVPVVGSAES